jgi:cell division protein FtsW
MEATTEKTEKKIHDDKAIWAIFILMCVGSVILMFSAINRWLIENPSAGKTALELTAQHGLFLAVAAVLAFVFSRVPIAWYRMKIFRLPVPLLALGAAGLMMLLLHSSSFAVEVNGASRELRLFGISFQAYELIKFFLVLGVSYILALFQRSEGTDGAFKYVTWIVVVAAAMILTENMSTAIIVVIITTILMWVGRISFVNILKFIGLMALAGGLLLAAGWLIPQSTLDKVGMGRLITQTGRIESFMEDKDETKNSTIVITDDNRQITHSVIAIAKGYDKIMPHPGSSTQQAVLSFAYMDFIFAIFVEEWGIVFTAILMLLYLILQYRAGIIARDSKHIFNSLFAVGVSLIIVLQAVISMAVCANMGPVTGQPLPLFSWGGTSIVITGIYFGILQGLYRDNQEEN